MLASLLHLFTWQRRISRQFIKLISLKSRLRVLHTCFIIEYFTYLNVTILETWCYNAK